MQKTRIGRSDVYAPDGLVYAPDGLMCTPDNLDRGAPKTKIHAPDGPVCTDRMVRCVRKVYVLLLALLKYTFYPLFILDNGMDLISKSLTVLTPA